MRDELSRWQYAGQAIAALLHPYGEVVIHDLQSGKIAAIWNPVSKRRVGDESLIDDDFPSAGGDGCLGPFKKVGRRGEQIKTVSAILPGEMGQPIGLMCINLDVTDASNAMRYLSSMLGSDKPKPEPLFSIDWRERIQELVYASATQLGKSPQGLTRKDRTAIVARLDAEGLFETRKAVDHAANVFGMSRTSLYNYLREIRGGAKA